MKIHWKVFWILLVLLGALIFPRLVLGSDVLQSWVAYCNSPENLDGWATDLEVDAARNVDVKGPSGPQVVVLKYDSERNLLWQQVPGPEVFPWSASFLELDATGNVYVAYTKVDEGTFPGTDIDCINIVTSKFDPSGFLHW